MALAAQELARQHKQVPRSWTTHVLPCKHYARDADLWAVSFYSPSPEFLGNRPHQNADVAVVALHAGFRRRRFLIGYCRTDYFINRTLRPAIERAEKSK
jgi:hypothetical protein